MSGEDTDGGTAAAKRSVQVVVTERLVISSSTLMMPEPSVQTLRGMSPWLCDVGHSLGKTSLEHGAYYDWHTPRKFGEKSGNTAERLLF